MVRQGKDLKIGIYGGTFNPVHYGHLINAEIVRQQYSLDRVLFIPDRVPVHKEITDCIDPDDRLHMLELAVRDNPYFEVSDIELKRPEPSYTILTIESLKKIYSEADLFLIIGSDSFNELDTWKSFREIIKLVPVIIMKRPGDTGLRDDILSMAGTFLVTDNPEIGISSSMIRKRVSGGLSVKYMMPDSVVEYVKIKELYQVG